MRFSEVTAALIAAGRDPYQVYDPRHDERLSAADVSRWHPTSPDAWSVLEIDDVTVVTLGPPQQRAVRGLQDLPDAIPFDSDEQAWAWVLEQAMSASDVGFRAVGARDLDPGVLDLLQRKGSEPRDRLLGLPTVAAGAGVTWRAAWIDGAYELHRLWGIGRTHGQVLRDPDLDLVQRVLVASLAESWWHSRPWRWPALRFTAATATPKEWARLRAASLAEVIAAVDVIDGAGVLTAWGWPIPEDLVTDAVYARAAPQRLYPYGSRTDPETVHLGDGGDRSHFSVVRRPTTPRYELIEMPERSNQGRTVLRTDDPAELEAELLRRI